MITASSAFNTAYADPTHTKNVQIEVEGVSTAIDYSILYDATITGDIFAEDHLSIGGCVARELKFTFDYKTYNKTIPRMAKLTVKLKCTAGRNNGTVTVGTFYVDSRSYDEQTGLATITAYDSMLRSEQLFIKEGDILDDYPMLMSTAVAKIATAMGISQDSRNSFNSSYTIQLPSGYTMREVLASIAAAHGGNFVITPDNKLRLIKVGYFATGSNIDLGVNVYSIKTGRAVPKCNKVTMDVTDESYLESVDSELPAGSELSCECVWGLQEICNDVLTEVQKLTTYRPFEATGAVITPLAELGDSVTINGTRYILAHQELTLSSAWISTISSPGENEIDHEYHYESSSSRDTRRRLANTALQLSITMEGIDSKVNDLDGNFSEFVQRVDGLSTTVDTTVEKLDNVVDSDLPEITRQISTLEQTSSALQLEFDKIVDDGVDRVTTKTGYRFDEDGLTISKTGSGLKNKIDNTGMFVRDQNDNDILIADQHGVNAVDITVKNYLIVGHHLRIQDYDNGVDHERAGFFWLGGEDLNGN